MRLSRMRPQLVFAVDPGRLHAASQRGQHVQFGVVANVQHLVGGYAGSLRGRQSFQRLRFAQAAAYQRHLRLAACFAGSEHVKEEIALGESLLGECALAGQSQVIETPPSGIWTINSGLGHSQPAALLLGPIRAQGDLLGVVELAVLKAPDDDLKTLFNEMLELLALNLKLASRNLSAGAVS